MIKPGLRRIEKLLAGRRPLWKSVHVAGTNGKGSVCAYLSSMLYELGVKTGRFTSPHLIHRWDCIQIDCVPVPKPLFLEVEQYFQALNESSSIDASPFEILTATAFEIFSREKVSIGVIECGMGGLEDATNVLPPEKKIATVVSRVGLDHKEFLGDTVEVIAKNKAGIFSPFASAIADGSNDSSIQQALMSEAEQRGVELVIAGVELDKPLSVRMRADVINTEIVAPLYKMSEKYMSEFGDVDPHLRLNLEELASDMKLAYKADYQLNNMAVAVQALRRALPALQARVKTPKQVLFTLANTILPGRLQWHSIEHITRRREAILLDGAHNEQAFGQLIDYIYSHFWQSQTRVWILALSSGRDIVDFIKKIRPSDTVIFVEFGAVDGMPWVKAVDNETLIARVKQLKQNEPGSQVRERCETWKTDIIGALMRATELANGNPIIVAGSLYLIGQVLKISEKLLETR